MNNGKPPFEDGVYDDIIDLAHHVSAVRPQMPMADRAAQFSPFAALVGYDAVIRESGRLTQERIELGEDARESLDEAYRQFMSRLPDAPEMCITYFRADQRKAGGAYVKVKGRVKKVEEAAGVIVLADGTRIPMEDICEMEEIGQQ